MNNKFVALATTALLFTNYAPVHAAQITKAEAITASTHNLTVTIDHTLATPVAAFAPMGVTVGAALTQDTVVVPKTLKETAHEMVSQRFGTASIASFDAIVAHESNWNPEAVNASSGACGLGQALPCSKIADHSATGQIQWMIDYIAGRYGTPAAAWHFWQAHHWY